MSLCAVEELALSLSAAETLLLAWYGKGAVAPVLCDGFGLIDLSPTDANGGTHLDRVPFVAFVTIDWEESPAEAVVVLFLLVNSGGLLQGSAERPSADDKELLIAYCGLLVLQTLM